MGRQSAGFRAWRASERLGIGVARPPGDGERAARVEGRPMSGTSTRCFVAVLLPERVRAGLAAVCAELRGQTRGLAWVREDNLHLTLRFLGNVEPGMLPHVRTAVMTAAGAVEPF